MSDSDSSSSDEDSDSDSESSDSDDESPMDPVENTLQSRSPTTVQLHSQANFQTGLFVQEPKREFQYEDITEPFPIPHDLSHDQSHDQSHHLQSKKGSKGTKRVRESGSPNSSKISKCSSNQSVHSGKIPLSSIKQEPYSDEEGEIKATNFGQLPHPAVKEEEESSMMVQIPLSKVHRKPGKPQVRPTYCMYLNLSFPSLP